MALTFYRNKDRRVIAKVSVVTTMWLPVETLAKMWLHHDLDVAAPASKNQLETFVRDSARLYGENWEDRVGLHGSGWVEDPKEYDQDHVKAQLAATVHAIETLYGLKE